MSVSERLQKKLCEKKKEQRFQDRRKALEALPDDTMFYWQSYGFVGNCLNLWAINGAGYTTKLSKAQLYNKEKTIAQFNNRRPQDTFWISTDLINASAAMVDHQDLNSKQSY